MLRVIRPGTVWPTGSPVAAFDLDHTLVRPKSKRKFAKDSDDWTFMEINGAGVLKSMKILCALGYQIVIFSNQKNAVDPELRINNILGALAEEGVRAVAYAATADDKYRKPRLGMLEEFQKDYPNSGPLWYCGDAAGRRDDFSASDYAFVYNFTGKIGSRFLDFVTPEELFNDKMSEKLQVLCQRESPLKDSFGWRTMRQPVFDWKKTRPDLVRQPAPGDSISPDGVIETFDPGSRGLLVIFVGYPASGKTTLARRLGEHLGAKVLSHDIQGAKCVKICKESLAKGVSVIIDGCNGTDIARTRYKKDVPSEKVHTVQMLATMEQAMLLNQRRSWGPDGPKPIPDIAFRAFAKRFEDPLGQNIRRCAFDIEPTGIVYP